MHETSVMEDGEEDEMHQYHYDGDGDNVIKKDWFGPAIASMARLNQIQTSVYNMGLHNPDILKPTQKLKRNQQQQMTNRSKLSPQPMLNEGTQEGTQDEDNGMRQELASRKLQPSPLHMETAWGSTHSIPELMARQNKSIVHRPSSAKILSECRLKTSSALKGRPQSAKEPLCKNDDQRKRRNLGVMGCKKNVLPSKPPPRPAAPVVNHPLINKAWAGPPPGCKMNPDQVMQDPTKMRGDSLTAPCSSPVLSDDESVDEEIGKAPPLLRRPLATPIHLSLPSADEVFDLNRDEEDKKQEPDTDRLLKDADNFMKKQRDKDILDNKNTPQSWNATMPENSLSSALPHSNFIEAMNRDSCDVKEFVSTSNNQYNIQNKNETAAHRKSGHSEQTFIRNGLSHEVDRSNNSHQSIVGDFGQKSTNRESKVTTSKSGVKIREDRNVTVDITPRNVGRKVFDKNSSFSKKLDVKSDFSSIHSECPCDINLEDLSLTDKERRDLIEYRNNNQVMKKPARESFVSMVSVEYEEDNQIIIEKKTPVRKKKRMSEIETLVSQLSQGEPGNYEVTQDKNDETCITELLHKSQTERNYYEIARNKTQRSTRPTSQEGNLNENPASNTTVVYKTTKTMEFDSEHEISMKSVICSQTPVKSKTDPSIPVSYTIKPAKYREKSTKEDSLIKKSTDKNSSPVQIDGQKSEADMDVLEGMLQDAKAMARSSINDAFRSRPPSGRTTTPQNRPRPSSSHQNKVKTESNQKPRPPLIRASSLSDIDKDKLPEQDTTSKSKQRCRHTVKPPLTGARPSSRLTIDDTKPLVISTVRSKTSFETPSSLHCKEMQSKMSAFGLNVDADLLERALFPPSGNNLYYDVPGELPKDLSAGLLSHYKHWLPEDYKRIKIMEQRLAQDDHIRYLQELAAKKKVKKAAAKLKGKKGKKKKLIRRNSVS